MATVVLQTVVLTDGTDQSDSVDVKITNLVDTPTTGGQIRTYAGGRMRWITTPGVTRKISLTAQLVDADTFAWIEAHKDALIVLRDPTGRKRWCSYATFAATPYTFSDLHDIGSWDLYEVTHSEAV